MNWPPTPLAELDWNPPRFASTAFGNAWINPVMWNAFMGWKGVDQYDEADKVGQAFLDRYQETYGPAISWPDSSMPRGRQLAPGRPIR